MLASLTGTTTFIAVVNPRSSFVTLIYVVPAPVEIIFPYWSTSTMSLFKLLKVFVPASIVSTSKLNPLLTLTSIFLVCPISSKITYFSLTSSFGLLIHSTNFVLTLASFPSSPFLLYPTVQTVPSYLTNVE